MKNIISKMENSIHGLNGRLDISGEMSKMNFKTYSRTHPNEAERNKTEKSEQSLFYR